MLNKDHEILTNNIYLVFRLDPKIHDISTDSSMKPLMVNLAEQLNCNLLTFNSILNRKTNELRKVYSISLISPINYQIITCEIILNKYKLLGTKYKDFKD